MANEHPPQPHPDNADAPLPRLSPMLKIFSAPAKQDGSPSWTLFHPLTNKYYQIGWVEFECIARFTKARTIGELVSLVNKETSLNIDKKDVMAVLHLLQQFKALDMPVVPMDSYEDNKPKQQNIFVKLAHSYLFFSIPLVKPQEFLKRTYPFVKFFGHSNFLKVVMIVFFVLAIMTAARLDEFTHTFVNFMSLEGVVTLFATLFVIKIFHELGHAYTAYHHGVSVPHMGIAFMVMYPVLYTETSAAWQLSDRRARKNIGLAGIKTELVLATCALLLWNISPPGLLQSMAFAVVGIALLGSLFVNLNPLMRFDGYFVLSDMLGIENLHAKGFARAKWWIRKTLWALDDPAPDDFDPKTGRFLIVFGLATMIYRFFLFLGIALLVYWLFFKPLGLVLMILELVWFIFVPIYRELSLWWERKADIWAQKQAKIVILAFIAAFLMLFTPISGRVHAPAMLYAENNRVIYPPEEALIVSLHVQDGQFVQQGEVLAVLKSDILMRDIAKERAKLMALKARKRVMASTNPSQIKALSEEITVSEAVLDDLNKKQERLIIRAPFDGYIRQDNPYLIENIMVSGSQPLFSVVDPSRLRVSAYVDENDIARLQAGLKARFISHHHLMDHIPLEIESLERTGTDIVPWMDLASIHAGPIAGELKFNERSNQEQFIARKSLYTVHFGAFSSDFLEQDNAVLAKKGSIWIDVSPYSPMHRFFHDFSALVIREAGFN